MKVDLGALGEEIKRLREARGLSQEQLGELVGIHRTTMSRYELGADMPVMVLARMICALDVDINELLGVVMKEDDN